MTKERPTPGRVTVSTGLNAAYVDGYWTQIDGMNQQEWMSYTPTKRYETVLNHLAAQATLAKKLAQREQTE